jgi:hypothetical protein
MDDQAIKVILEAMPHKVAMDYYQSFNAVIDGIKVEKPDFELNQFQIADLMHNCLGTIVATYIHNMPEQGLREYIASKLMFHLTGTLLKHVEALAAMPPPEAIPPAPETLPEGSVIVTPDLVAIPQSLEATNSSTEPLPETI